MQRKNVDGLRVAILVADNFEQIEMTSPRKALEQEGAKITLISSQTGPVTGRKHDIDRLDTFEVELPLAQARPDNFDALMLPGGSLNADHLRMHQQARDFVRAFDSANKPIAAILPRALAARLRRHRPGANTHQLVQFAGRYPQRRWDLG